MTSNVSLVYGFVTFRARSAWAAFGNTSLRLSLVGGGGVTELSVAESSSMASTGFSGVFVDFGDSDIFHANLPEIFEQFMLIRVYTGLARVQVNIESMRDSNHKEQTEAQYNLLPNRCSSKNNQFYMRYSMGREPELSPHQVFGSLTFYSYIL